MVLLVFDGADLFALLQNKIRDGLAVQQVAIVPLVALYLNPLEQWILSIRQRNNKACRSKHMSKMATDRSRVMNATAWRQSR